MAGQIHVLAAFFFRGENPSLLIAYEAEWIPESVWKPWKRDKVFVPPWSRITILRSSKL